MGSKGYKDNNTSDMRGGFEEVMFSEDVNGEEDTSAKVGGRASCREKKGREKMTFLPQNAVWGQLGGGQSSRLRWGGQRAGSRVRGGAWSPEGRQQ